MWVDLEFVDGGVGVEFGCCVVGVFVEEEGDVVFGVGWVEYEY